MKTEGHRLAIASEGALPAWEKDDLPFESALRDLGVEVERVVWDDPSVQYESYDACLIRTTWDYSEKIAEFEDWIQETSCRCCLLQGASVLRWNLDKSYLQELDGAGFPVAWTLGLASPLSYEDAEAALRTLREAGVTRALCKPRIGASAIDTLRLRADKEEAPRLVELAGSGRRGGFLLQPYLELVETLGEVSAIFFDGEFSHGVRKCPVPGDYRVQDDHGATDEPFEFHDEELDLARSILEWCFERHAGNLDGEPLLYARVDFLRDEKRGFLVNEVELVEPSLFFRHDATSPARFAAAVLRRLDTNREATPRSVL